MPLIGKIRHVGKQDSLLEILLCMRISHCFVWLGEMGRKETRQWMGGTKGQDDVFGVCKWILKMQDSLLVCSCIRAGGRTGGVSNGTLNFSVDMVLWAH